MSGEAELRGAIERRIRELLADEDPRFDWVKPIVRAHAFLPIYLGWVSAIGVRADASFVQWDHEDDPEAVRPLVDPYWQRMALCAGAKNYPELAALIPARPFDARTCEACAGTGTIEGAPRLMCQCGGLGWVIPGERAGPSPG
jgi:hypothetical protein